jgi:hypothetical protein
MPRLLPRPLHLPLTVPTGMLAVVMASSLALPFTAGVARGGWTTSGSDAAAPLLAQAKGSMPAGSSAQPRRAQPSAAITEARARSAAERILAALKSGDANARYAQFSPELQRMTSPALVQSHIRRQPKVLSWTITAVAPGVDSSTVEAALQTSAGRRDLLMVIDGDGRLEGYHFDVSDQPAEEVARRFMQALIEGRYVYAVSFLNPDLQTEIPPASLQNKWQNLQRLTGNFVRVRKINRSEHTPDMKLVMVTTEFTRLTDNLYVILDSANEIIGVDFPTEPAAPKAAR